MIPWPRYEINQDIRWWIHIKRKSGTFTHNGILFSHKSIETLPLVTTWIAL
jgi:hypothetical protein